MILELRKAFRPSWIGSGFTEKLGKFFEIPAAFWLNLQNLYDLEEAERLHEKDIKSIQTAKALGLIPAVVASGFKGLHNASHWQE